jgi:hypothetical protein
MAEYLASVPFRKLDFNRKLHALHDKESSKDILASIVKTGLGLIKLSVRYQPERFGIINILV